VLSDAVRVSVHWPGISSFSRRIEFLVIGDSMCFIGLQLMFSFIEASVTLPCGGVYCAIRPVSVGVSEEPIDSIFRVEE
jgi:hypothetical protein